ncbi:methyl-accepting chemotaxis protein [Sphingomonas psychrolutea]|uniref:Methyl-accepting chemotaxis protein n=1 Tax=Sphingomonas psychrolutea TaxID=1259676 RepID=A0ABQ1GK23_9SPHN|nr:HAMP domain-containing methyl-accepting chemotaxis protein [Sphingomonas psychrolutea]GGA45364.1 methyl-accepting chemotaxis protein [Sphingomonas psychrolutea]
MISFIRFFPKVGLPVSIAKRLQIGTALIIGIVLIAIGIAAYSINVVRIGGPVAEQIQSASDYVADILPPPEYVLEPFLEATLLANHPDQIDARAARLAALRRDYDDRHAYWLRANLDPALVVALTRDADAPARRFWDGVDRLKAAARAGDPIAIHASYARLAADYATHRALIDRAVTLAGQHQTLLKARSSATLTAASIALLALAAMVLGLAIGAGVYLTRTVMTPLGSLIEVTMALANGSDRAVPYCDRRDELGDMARAVDVFSCAARDRAIEDARTSAEQTFIADNLGQMLRTMASGDLRHSTTIVFPPSYAGVHADLDRAIDTLRTMVRAVVDTTSDIDATSGSIARATDDLAQRTECSAAAIEETSAAIEQMDQRLRSTAQAAQKSSQGSQQTLDAAGDVRKRTDGAIEAMRRVSVSTAGIDDVIEGLDKIAFQTRVLAMNAAVEAGRAGDAGRGFAVVADLVSTLAMRAEEEAKRARVQLSATQDDVGVAVTAVGQVDGALETILARCAEGASLSRDIADDNAALASSIGEIKGAVTQLDGIAQQNAAMVEETSAAAASLACDIATLAGHASAFRHDGREQDVPVALDQRVRVARGLPSAVVPILSALARIPRVPVVPMVSA